MGAHTVIPPALAHANVCAILVFRDRSVLFKSLWYCVLAGSGTLLDQVPSCAICDIGFCHERSLLANLRCYAREATGLAWLESLFLDIGWTTLRRIVEGGCSCGKASLHTAACEPTCRLVLLMGVLLWIEMDLPVIRRDVISALLSSKRCKRSWTPLMLECSWGRKAPSKVRESRFLAWVMTSTTLAACPLRLRDNRSYHVLDPPSVLITMHAVWYSGNHG